MKSVIAASTLIATLGLSAANPALAWGDREQGILTGIVGLHIWNKLHERSDRHDSHSYSRSPNVERLGERFSEHRSHPPGRSHLHRHDRPIVVYQEPIVIHETYRVIQDPTKNCRLIPVRDETGRILEYRALCE